MEANFVLEKEKVKRLSGNVRFIIIIILKL